MPRFGKERLRLEPAKGVLCRWKRQERKRTLALLRSRLSKKSTACVDGGASSPARCRGSNFQFEPRQFRPQGETAESCGFCASCHPHHNLLEFSFGKLWPQIVQGSDFCSGKWDFPTQKSAPVPDARGDFADFPNRQNRSALADLKTLWVFNLLAGNDLWLFVKCWGKDPARAESSP